jgi:hypothetical protein
MSMKWWYLFYAVCSSLILLAVLYMALLSCRQPENSKCTEKWEKAFHKREETRRELMPDDAEELTFGGNSFHNAHTAAMRGGRGVVLYFNWLVLGMIVALTLSSGNFVAFELSDLGRRSHEDKKKPECAVAPVGDLTDNTTVSTYMRAGSPYSVQKSKPEEWEERSIETIRNSLRLIPFLNEAEETGSVSDRYAQAHHRLFRSSIVTYTIIVALVLAFCVFQLGVIEKHFHDTEPHARRFAANVRSINMQLQTS